MQITLSMFLPRDYATLPLVRHLAKHSLWEIGVDGDCISDIELALTEACANVVEHASGEDEYEVDITISDEICEIRVVDTGRGFDFESLGAGHGADPGAEGGRGIQLMRALVDNIRFQSMPEAGTIVHLVKQLVFDDRPRPSVRRVEGARFRDAEPSLPSTASPGAAAAAPPRPPPH